MIGIKKIADAVISFKTQKNDIEIQIYLLRKDTSPLHMKYQGFTEKLKWIKQINEKTIKCAN